MIDFFFQSTHSVYLVSCVSKTQTVCLSWHDQPINAEVYNKRKQKLSSVDHWNTEAKWRHRSGEFKLQSLSPDAKDFSVNLDAKPDETLIISTLTSVSLTTSNWQNDNYIVIIRIYFSCSSAWLETERFCCFSFISASAHCCYITHDDFHLFVFFSRKRTAT